MPHKKDAMLKYGLTDCKNYVIGMPTWSVGKAQKMVSVFTSAAYIQVHFRVGFYHGGLHCQPDKTEKGPHCLKYSRQSRRQKW